MSCEAASASMIGLVIIMSILIIIGMVISWGLKERYRLLQYQIKTLDTLRDRRRR